MTDQKHSLPDRRVHAEGPNGCFAVVRYELAGKWYVEDPAGRRRRVSLAEAAEEALLARNSGGILLTGVPGGAAFDHKVAKKDRSLHHG